MDTLQILSDLEMRTYGLLHVNDMRDTHHNIQWFNILTNNNRIPAVHELDALSNALPDVNLLLLSGLLRK